MTEYIRREGLLDPGYVDDLIEHAPTAIVEQRFTHGEAIPSWHDFLEAFTPERGCNFRNKIPESRKKTGRQRKLYSVHRV